MKKFLFSIVLVLVSLGAMQAQVLEKTYHFDQPLITTVDGYTTISFENTMPAGIAGEPMLPYHSVSLLLPPGTAAKDIVLLTGEKVTFDDSFTIYPMQHSRPLSEGASGTFVINSQVYQSDAAYPATLHGHITTQYMNGYAVAMCSFTPVEYIPETGQISYYKNITVQIGATASEQSVAAMQNLRTSSQIESRLKALVQNQEAIATYPATDSRSDDYQMLIITSSQFAPGFGELAEFYKPRGIKAQVAVTTDIYAQMTGVDNQEKIRNYIIQEYQQHGIEQVTLGGDVEHVPYRGFYCKVQSSTVYEDSDIPADLYYAALDGTWNDNGNNKWGEIGEDDLLPEIGIGRFSISNQTEFNALMNKTIQYQQNPVLGELEKPLLVGEWLYDNPETWGSDYLELLIGYHDDNGYTTNGIPEDQDIQKLYESDGSWSATTLKNKMNQGSSFIHHVGHANSNYAMKFYNSDITNNNFAPLDGTTHNYSLIFSHGCICGAFDDSDCIGEKMITIENLAVAVYMNSRYGWFNEGQTEGPAAHLNRELVDAFYDKKESRLGVAYTMARIETAPWVTAPGQHEEGALRWNFYDCNLLGDAAVSFWSAEPIEISASYQEALPIGVPSISITLTGNGNTEGLNCTFIKDDQVYGIAQTNAAGTAEIVFDEPITELGEAMIYVAGYNCLLHEYPVMVIPNNGAYVVYSSSVINDASGNNNGQADYTESIMLSTALQNVGTVQADNVTATLASADAYVTITDNTEEYGDIAGGASVNMENAFAFDIAGNIPDQHAVLFNLEAAGQETWNSGFSVIVNAPALAMAGFVVNDASGNNNGMLDPGETADMIITGINNGHAQAFDVSSMLSTSDAYFTINTTSAQNLGDMNPGEGAMATFSVTVDNDIPAGHVSILSFNMEAMHGITASADISVSFTDYCEATSSYQDEYISNVSMGDINNSSSWQGGVANYTDQSTVIEPGASEQITVTNGNAWSSDKVTVWVDWNLNKELGDQANEIFVLQNVGGSGQTFVGDIQVPAVQMAGSYRMRVRMTYSSDPQPCDNASYGEVEDYTIIVSGGVLAVNVTCSPDEICEGEASQMMASAGGGSGFYTYLWTPPTGLNDPTIANPIASPTETTVYTVEVSDGITTISEQITITVHEVPDTPFINLQGETLYSDAPEGNQWYDSQGAIAGATGQSYTCTWEDVYHVVVTSQQGCVSDPSNSIHVVVSGIGEPGDADRLTIAPNPFGEELNITVDLQQGTRYSLAITNALGQEVIMVSQNSRATGSAETFHVNGRQLQRGIYFVKLTANEVVRMTKIIK
ncbi:MAG: C25 family cysteine peptidase [Bacteroidales bacterium]